MSIDTRRELLQLTFAGSLASLIPPSPSPAPAAGPARIRARMFWTWDHSTEWALNLPGAQTRGAMNNYTRSQTAFLKDYTKLLRWCGRHGVDAVVIWGLLRDGHGGLEAAKQLCDISAENHVRILCGVGLTAYGGVYYEGNSPHSLEQYLEEHPELAALDAKGNRLCKPHQCRACPSRHENQEFAAESLSWLFNALPQLGGVQVETGDFGVCQCELCRKRRHHPVQASSWDDMALYYPIAADAVHSVSPKAWIVCETYSNPEPYRGPKPVPGFGEGKPAWADECMASFPRGDTVFVQWVCDDYVKPRSRTVWTDAGRVSSARHNVMRAHFSTYWAGLRGELAIDWIADMVQQSMAHGIDAISIFGEVSPFDAGAELNYLALENYGSAANPSATVDVFLRDVAGPLLGGATLARDYLRYARLMEHREQIPAALPSIYANCGKLPAAAARRWAWLGNYLASFVEDTAPASIGL